MSLLRRVQGGGMIWRQTLLIAALLLCAMPASAWQRVYRCVGTHGELVFRDQPCRYAGLAKLGAPKSSSGIATIADEERAGSCAFISEPLTFLEPLLAQSTVRLQIDIDDEGPYLTIGAEGVYQKVIVFCPLLLIRGSVVKVCKLKAIIFRPPNGAWVSKLWASVDHGCGVCWLIYRVCRRRWWFGSKGWSRRCSRFPFHPNRCVKPSTTRVAAGKRERPK